MKQLPFEVSIREAKPEDLAFIIGTWLESFKQDAKPGSWLSLLKWARYRPVQTKVITNLLKSATVMVASLPDDPDHLIGHAVGSKVNGVNVLHYVYVRQNRRRVGLALNLSESILNKLDGKFEEYSHHTRVGFEFAKKLNLTYNPLTSISE